jgi:hypothetical protein
VLPGESLKCSACGRVMWNLRIEESDRLAITCSDRQCINFGKVFEMPPIPLRLIPGVKSELT